jgi:2-polyprenyl-6-methoxyphenol hydroxylase-like FAD-dependent oxidoreductase
MTDNLVIVAGGGIGGLATALTLQQIGVPCIVFEAAAEMRPLGVGINLQPNAVRELYDLGIMQQDLDRLGRPGAEPENIELARQELAKGTGIAKTARLVGLGTGTLHRVKRLMTSPHPTA